MKILITELQMTKGHTNLFVNICKILNTRGHELYVIIPKNFLGVIEGPQVIESPHTYYADTFKKDSAINRVKHNYCNAKFIENLSRDLNVDIIILVTYDEIGFAFSRLIMPRFRQLKTCVIHNNNIDNIILSRFRSIAFSLFRDNVKHIVLADFIKDGLIKLGVNDASICILPHPMKVADKNKMRDIDCVGLSNGNSESIIEELIAREEKYEVFKKRNLHILLKSKYNNFDNGYLKIINGFLDEKIYEDYMLRARSVFMPFPLDFNYRMSGTLVDALANSTPVIATDIPVVRKCAKTYPDIIRIFNIDNFPEVIQELSIVDTSKERQFAQFKEIRSKINLSKIIDSYLKSSSLYKRREGKIDF